MSQQKKSIAFNDHQNATKDASQDCLSRTATIRSAWNDSVKKCRAQQARLMQLRLAALILPQPKAA